MLQRIKRFFGFGPSPPPTNESAYHKGNILGHPGYFPGPYGPAPWNYPMYPPGMPQNGPNHTVWSPYQQWPPGPWDTSSTVYPQGQFPQVYAPPPYPPPAPGQVFPAPHVQTFNPGYPGYPVQMLPPPPANPQPIQAEPSYQWPDGDVKLECTAGHEPAGWDDQGWMWRSSGPRKIGLPEGAYKVDKRVCLGVFRCRCTSAAGDPSRFFRPRKEKAARERQLSETCHICRSTLTLIPCEASLTYYRYRGHGGVEHSVRQHLGRHEHPHPPIKILSAADRAALDQQVRENPSLTAQQLRAGAGPTQVALGDINPVLLGARKARHEVENSKVRQGIVGPATTRNSGFQLLSSLTSLQESFDTPWIVNSNLMDGQFIIMQTPFMRDTLLRDQVQSWHQETLEAESGRHGVVTDGCHDFFKQGILLVSLVFSPILLRWAPILFTWIGRFDEHHHKSHFAQLVYVIAELCTQGLGHAFDERLYSAVFAFFSLRTMVILNLFPQILDFSSAQRNGFISAFVEFMCSRIPGWSTLSEQSRRAEASALRTRAEALIKGCFIHWKRSLHKIKQVIGAQHLFRFEALINVLESEHSTAVEFFEAVELIRAEFAEVRPWLSWWILPGNGSMIFPAMQKMPAELRARLPNSTNASESGHWLLYRAVGQGFDLWDGVRRLYRFQRETEMLYAAVLAGHVDARFQGTKAQPKSRIKWHPNDGRAPDTRERLAAIQKIEGDFNALTSELNDGERWKACNSALAVDVPPPAPTNSTPPTQLMRQSYKWEANSCFIDAPLEAYFRVFIAMGDAARGDLLRRIRGDAPMTGLRDVFEHLWLRGLLSGAIATTKSSSNVVPSAVKLGHALVAGQLNVKRLISTKWDAGQLSDGMPGCARTWLNQMITTDTTNTVQKYFGIRHALHYTCPKAHLTTQTNSTVWVENGISHGDIFLAHHYIPESSHQPSLANYLVHSIPRQRLGNDMRLLHQEPPIVCSNPDCHGGEATMAAVSTDWPLILRMDPISHTPNLSLVSDRREIACPLVMKLGGQVEYELVARVIYIGPTADGSLGHYVTKTRLKGNTYMYDDTRRNGCLNELGPLHLLEDHDPNTAFVLYHRTSQSFKTSRTVAEIQGDFEKIPVVPITIEIIPDVPNTAKPAAPSPPAPEDDEVDQMIIDSIASPTKSSQSSDRFYTPEQSPGDASRAETDSSTPCPVLCVPCGANFPEGDDDPNEVQCGRCKFWSHFKCYPGTDWNDENEDFFCRTCREEIRLEFYQPGTIAMLPEPQSDWKDKKTLWYPAKFIKHHKNRANGPYEYEFEWLACLDGTLYNTEFSSVPELRRIYHRGRESLEAIQYVKLSDQQIGNIRLPFYEDTNFEDHENPELTVIFNAAIPQIAKILAAWDQQHCAMQSLSRFTGSKHINQVQKSSEWMVALGLALTPELEAVLAPANIRLLQHKSLAHLHHEERLARVTGIGSALLHFLVVQHELKEPLNLNGDLVNDLWDNSVVTCGGDGKAALQAMYGAVNDGVLPGANHSQKMSRFFDRHTVFDSHWRPPLYRRLRNSQFASTEAILVTVSTGSKRKAEEQLEGSKGPKRSKLEEPKKVKAQQKTKNSGAGTNMAAPGNNRRILPSRKCASRV
ncbi:hypothetical protein B0H16DRAFT_1886485 [Mycena metata]|uniref:GCM domain-containing protein n=1 Tax=Mycena metata TaxID=1033252 RepID=A0AAD7J0Z1_9AGAR|nr:hypothetical protein B0H16DRAFT_1886485 [Mycena metata]